MATLGLGFPVFLNPFEFSFLLNYYYLVRVQ